MPLKCGANEGFVRAIVLVPIHQDHGLADGEEEAGANWRFRDGRGKQFRGGLARLPQAGLSALNVQEYLANELVVAPARELAKAVDFVDQDSRLAVLRKRLRQSPLEGVERPTRLCGVVIGAYCSRYAGRKFFCHRLDKIRCVQRGIVLQNGD